MLPKLIKAVEIKEDWNKHLPEPLRKNEIVKVHTEQDTIGNKYVRVIRKKSGRVEVWGLSNFTDLKGKKLQR